MYGKICEDYELRSYPNKFAVRQQGMSDSMLNEFSSQHSLFVNESAFLDAITVHFSSRLQEIVAKHNKSH
ncbi:MAG: hypothetical protein OXD32_03875 [Endozoicomonadaceae bacterium]|nr:hypothetical protein [Endozoicomonadaceae bacterium]